MKTCTERLWRRVDRSDPKACWIWPGAAAGHGYGHIRRGGRDEGMAYVHVIAYESVHGPVPAGLEVDHFCHSEAVLKGACQGGKTCLHRRCVNPSHLQAVTRQQNLLRSHGACALRTHCPAGHPYAGQNLISNRNGSRACRTCKNARRRKAVTSDSLLREPVNAEGEGRYADA